jgi:hypothetical protein
MLLEEGAICQDMRAGLGINRVTVLYLSLASISPHMTDSGTMRTEASLLSVWAPASSSTMTDFTLDHSLTVRRAKQRVEQIIVNKVNNHHHNLEPKLTIDDVFSSVHPGASSCL